MKKVLIIEDNQDNMVLLTRLLQKAGYQTLEAMTGQKGFEAALREQPDVILLDIQLPDIMGTEVLKLIRVTDTWKSLSTPSESFHKLKRLSVRMDENPNR